LRHGGRTPSGARSLRPQLLTCCRGNLFGIDLTPVPSSNSSSDVPVGEPRLERANRVQLRMKARYLEDLVPDDHRVRALCLQ
jgi:hypothetical protein